MGGIIYGGGCHYFHTVCNFFFLKDDRIKLSSKLWSVQFVFSRNMKFSNALTQIHHVLFCLRRVRGPVLFSVPMMLVVPTPFVSIRHVRFPGSALFQAPPCGFGDALYRMFGCHFITLCSVGFSVCPFSFRFFSFHVFFSINQVVSPRHTEIHIILQIRKFYDWFLLFNGWVNYCEEEGVASHLSPWNVIVPQSPPGASWVVDDLPPPLHPPCGLQLSFPKHRQNWLAPLHTYLSWLSKVCR